MRSYLPPSVQVEVEGRAKGQRKEDGLPLAGRGLAEVQAMGHLSMLNSTHGSRRHLNRLE